MIQRMEKKHANIAGEGTSVMALLKQQTAEHHRQIERVSRMQRLFADDYSVAEYALLVGRLYGFLSAFENAMSPILADQPAALQAFFAERGKLGWLEQDLSALGLSSTEIAALPKAPALTFMDGLPACFGASYVMEGSTLGGQVIVKHLLQRFSSDINGRIRYYQGYGEQTLERWRQFAALLEHHFPDARKNQVGEITAAACLTFESLQDWLNRN